MSWSSVRKPDALFVYIRACQVFLRFEIVIFNNNFVFCMMSSFCSMARVIRKTAIKAPKQGVKFVQT